MTIRFGEHWMAWWLVVVVGLGALVGFVVPRLGPGRRRVHHPRYDAVGPAAAAAAGAAVATCVAAVVGSVAAVGAAVLLLVLGLINPRTLWHLRTGLISPEQAARFVADKLGAETLPTRPRTPDRRGARRNGMANAVFRLGTMVAALADTNEPPFYKSFLSMDIVNRVLEIRCWGVTGYADGDRSPSLEDCIRIALAPPAAAAAPGVNDVHTVRTPSQR
jgi:hypothetical protein